jgi:hypothetical protein
MKKSLLAISILFFTFVFVKAQTFQWAKQFGGPSDSSSFIPSWTFSSAITYDDYGNVYTIGTYNVNVDFDPGPDTFKLISSMGSSENDIFISKLDANGNFVWAKKIGGISLESATAIVVKNNKDIYITGYIASNTDFDPGPNVFNVTVNNYYTAFLLKLDTGGNFQWVKTISGMPIGNYYRGAGISSLVFDNTGNILIGGSFNGIADFDPGVGVSNLTASVGYRDAFIAKWDSLGNFIWAKNFGNSELEYISSLDVDNSNNVYASGNYKGMIDMDPSSAVYNLDSIGGSDVFILKLDALGNFNWAKSIGGKSTDYSSHIELDSQGKIYLSGRFNDSADFDPSLSYNYLQSKGYSDVFISKFDNAGALIWVKSFGEMGYDDIQGMKLDKLSSNIYLTGQFQDSAIFNSNPSLNLYSIGGYSAYLVIIDSASNFIWAKNFDGTGSSGSAVNVDALNNIYLTGSFSDTTDFDFGPNTFNFNPNGFYDVFIIKVSGNTSHLNNLINSKNVALFPNPNSGLFNLNLKDKSTIQIIDAIGREVYYQKANAGMHQIDLSEKANGIYFMKVKTDKAIFIEQIIINH